MMGSDWHPHRHPQPDLNRLPQRTLPSFAELTSSSDSVLHRPRDSVPPAPPAANTADRPVSQSTPPTTLTALDFANSTQQASFTAINHTSPHVR
jgi:hypothetical protein